MHEVDPGKYISRLLEQSETGYATDIYTKIPEEFGKCRMEEKRTRSGVSCFDWSMRWQQDVRVEKNDSRSSEFIQFVFFMNCGFDWKIGNVGHTVSVEKGQVCIYWDSSAPSSGYYDKNRDFIFKSMQIPVSYFYRLADELFDGRERKAVERMLTSVTKTAITPYMYRILTEIEDIEKYQGGVGALYLESKMLELFAACLERGLESGNQALHKRLSISKTDQEVILSVKNRIDLDSANVPGCDQLARETNLSVSKLTKGFKELTGLPLHTYIIEKRLEYAACLLAQNRMNVSQAAICSGYSNMSHFSAAFRRKFGVKPKDYRR